MYEVTEKIETVPWAYMDYQTVLQYRLMPQLLDHLRTQLSHYKAEEYIIYLKTLCGFPSDFVQRHGVVLAHE